VHQAQGLTLVLTSACAAAVVVAGMTAALTTSPAAVVGDVVRHLTIATAVAVLGVLASALVPLRSPLAALKDR
jgi:hypothetical protein